MTEHERTGLHGVMADKGPGQGSLKYQRKAKCLIYCDMISLEIFRKKKKKKMTVRDVSLSTTTPEPFI